MSDDEGDGSGWRFELEDLEDGDEDEDDDPGAVEREAVNVENAAFVAAGVLLAVGAVVVLAL